MLTSKVIFDPNGYVELTSYQNLGETFTTERNDYFPLNDNSLIAASFEFPEISLTIDNGEYTYLSSATEKIIQISRWLKSKHYFGTKELGKKWEKYLAYMFATIRHETDKTYDWYSKEKFNITPGESFPGEQYFKNLYDKDKYGNQKGTLDYYHFRGRGLVHLTWRGNYKAIEEKIKTVNYNDTSYDWKDFYLVDPNGRTKDGPYSSQANRFVPACFIMSYGMQGGWFRLGHTLEKYYKLDDWVGARNIIQPVLNAEQTAIAIKIKGYYDKFYKVIHENSGF